MASLMARSPRRWTKQEDQILQHEAELQLSQGSVKDWNRIAAKLPGRTNKDCRKRFSKTYGSVRKGAWDQDEDERLLDAIRKHGLRWVQVAAEVETRNADQCSKRWQHSLDPSLDHGKWSQQDDERLLKAVEVYGRNWKTISINVFPSRSGTDIKNRHVCLVRKQKKNDAQAAEQGANSRSANSRRNSAQGQNSQGQDDEESEEESSDYEEEEEEGSQHTKASSAEDATFEFGNFLAGPGSVSGDFMSTGNMSDIAFTPSLTSSDHPSMGYESTDGHNRALMPLRTSVGGGSDTFAGLPFPPLPIPGKMSNQNNASGWDNYSTMMDTDFEASISASDHHFDASVSVGGQMLPSDSSNPPVSATASMAISATTITDSPTTGSRSPKDDPKLDPSRRNRLVLEDLDGETLKNIMGVITNSSRNVNMHFHRY